MASWYSWNSLNDRVRHAVHVARLVVIRVAERERVPVDEDVLVGARELVLVRQPRPAEETGLHRSAGQMAGRDVVVVRAVVDHRLPVGGLEPFHRAQGLHAAVPPIEHGVEIPARVAQIGLEARGVLGPGGKDDPGVGLHAGLDETKGRPVERVVVGLGLAGDVLEGAVVAVSPAVIGAHEAFGVAVVAAHHAVAAVAAHVQQRVQLALSVAGQDDRVLAHVGVEVIVGRGHQALVPDHQPGAAEDLLHLLVVDRLIAEDAAVDFAGGGVDDGVFPSGAHIRILALAVMITGVQVDQPANLRQCLRPLPTC